MDVSKYVSKSAKAGEIYYLQHLHDAWNHPEVRRLNANEILYGPCPEVRNAIIAQLDKLNYYPEDASTDVELRGKIADYIGLPGKADWITLGNGSMEIIDMIYKTFIDEGDDILVAMPEYSPYARRAKMFLANVIDIMPVDDDFNYDLNAYQSKVTDRTKMIVVSRPNNPDGHIVSRELVEELCKNDCIVVVDEAYVEFSGDPVEDILENHPNMIITHTFSKAMGLAAIRLGFAVASPELIGYINQVRMPTNVNVLARAAAAALLDNSHYIKENTDRIIADRQWLYAETAKIPGLRPIPSWSNFVMFDCRECKKTATEIYQYLKDAGYATRLFANSRGLPGDRFFRITIGTHEDIAEVIGLLKEFLK